MKVSAFKVSLVYSGQDSIDITDTILAVNINETLFGNLSGSIEVSDGLGLLDNSINNQTYVRVEFEYLKGRVHHDFYVDGVNSIDITTSLVKKTYVINLKAVDTLMDSMQLISKAFKGRSTDIIKTIFDEAFKTKLKVLADSITRGHYISPNVSPSKAIKQIQSRAYDLDTNPFFMFQRLIDNKHTFLTSLKQIELQDPSVKVSTQIQNKDTIERPMSNIGQPSSIVIHSDNDNMVYKAAQGAYGKTIIDLDISNSDIKSTVYGSTPGATSDVNLIRLDMFNDDTKPLLNGGDYSEVCKMQSILNMIFNTRITLYGCQSVPKLGVGKKISLDVKKNNQSQTTSNKFSGSYIVSNIKHRIVDNDYTQAIEIMRG